MVLIASFLSRTRRVAEENERESEKCEVVFPYFARTCREGCLRVVDR